MAALRLTRGSEGPRSWRPGRIDGRLVPLFNCPKCKDELMLAPPHIVSQDGTVTPEVQCPSEECNFTAKLTLKGYLAVVPPLKRRRRRQRQ